MDAVTPIFNDAAQGLEPPDGVAQSGPPLTPLSGPEYAASQETIAFDASAMEEFRRMHQAWQDPDLAEGETTSLETEDRANAIERLERLEAGLAQRESNANMRPWRKIERSVHADIERQRAHQIALLKEFIESNPYGERRVRAHGGDNELELAL